MNDRIFIHSKYDEENNVISYDWSPIRINDSDVEYLSAKPVLTIIDKLMTSAWNMKTIHLALHPDHKQASWIYELEVAMKFADRIFPPEEERQWRK